MIITPKEKYLELVSTSKLIEAKHSLFMLTILNFTHTCRYLLLDLFIWSVHLISSSMHSPNSCLFGYMFSHSLLTSFLFFFFHFKNVYSLIFPLFIHFFILLLWLTRSPLKYWNAVDSLVMNFNLVNHLPCFATLREI